MIPALLAEGGRDGRAFDVENPGVHHLAVDLHHHFVVLPVDHVLCKKKKKSESAVQRRDPKASQSRAFRTLFGLDWLQLKAEAELEQGGGDGNPFVGSHVEIYCAQHSPGLLRTIQRPSPRLASAFTCRK